MGPAEVVRGLSEAQAEAVTCTDLPLVVVAGPGSGKTTVLTHRIAFRIAAGTAAAEHTLALTFTRRAAGELRQRLARLGVGGPIAAGTFHAIAYVALRQRWLDRGQRLPVVLDRPGRVIARLLDSRSGDQLDSVLREIEWARALDIGPDEYEARADANGREPRAAPSVVAQVFAAYQREKHRRGLVDLDDLIAGCADALDDDATFAAAQRWRWRHVYVDEFQDLNPAHLRLLSGWLAGRADLFAVGDPDQAIYGWNGADAGLMATLVGRVGSGRELRLDHNFRSPPSIVAFADAALGRRSLMADAPADAVPTITEYATASDEAAGVALALQAAHRSGRPWSECAVLARTNAQLGVLADALSAAGVPCGDAPDDVVHLATFHRAKGLEWPIVFATGLEDGLVPFGAPPPGQRRDEERRLLYVALTRASGALHCSWARSRDLGEGPRTRRPSPWLAAMSATCDELDARRPPVDLRAELRALRVSLAAGAPPAPTVAARKRASARSA